MKLPESGDILFGIRIYLDPLAELAKHPHTKRDLRAALLALTQEERDYKGLRDTFDDVVAVIDSVGPPAA